MSASRTLLRKLDLDLIARIEASGKPEKPARKSATRKEPRPYRTYRQNGGGSKVSVKNGSFGGRISLNRSQNWLHARSYQQAREISPSAEPVR